MHPNGPNGKTDFSRIVPCKCTEKEADKERHARLFRYSNLGALSRLTFDDLVPGGRSGRPVDQDQFARAMKDAKEFAAQPQGWLVLQGPNGCGKTHLVAAIANARLAMGYPAFFISTPDLLDHLRSAYNPTSEVAYDQFFDQVKNSPLLILDDLGSQTASAWAKEKLEQLLNHRANNDLPTVIVVIEPIEQLDERIATLLKSPRISRIHTLEEKQAHLEYSWPAEFELQKSMTFDKFDKRHNLTQEQQHNLDKAFRVAIDFAKSPDGWLVFQGTNGCGKTHLAAAIANYRYQAGEPSLFVVVPDFLDHLRSSFSPESKISYDELFEKVKTTPLLILDDFGEQATTAWAQEKLYQVLNYRYNARLATVITTSSSIDDMDSPIASRLIDPKISLAFTIMAPDYRGDIKPRAKRTTRRSRK